MHFFLGLENTGAKRGRYAASFLHSPAFAIHYRVAFFVEF